MFTLYVFGGILVLIAIIYWLTKLADHLDTKYGYSMFDFINIGILCGTAVVTALLIGVCIGHDAPQYQGGIFDPIQNIQMLFYVNLAVLVFVFIRNWVKSSLLCSLVITPLQVMAATVLLFVVFAVVTTIENIYKNLTGSGRSQQKV
ncbi:MAG: hypothetical protein ABSB11_11885 [Sedimentisphaerales bacterium]|jgi:hypothetical protein